MDSKVESTEEIKNGKSETDLNNEVNSNHANQNCALCGCSTPAVRCDKCSSQIFCLSCDDMYHRHPKRRLHLRKAVDSIWNSHRSPCLRRRTNLPGDPSKIPIPPPRRKRRERYTISGAGLPKSAFEIPTFSGREPWAARGPHVRSPVISDSFVSDDSLPPLPKQPKSSVEQKYENSDAILQQNNGLDSQAGRTPESEAAEKMFLEEQRLNSMQSPSSPSQPFQVEMPDGRMLGSPPQMYSRGSQMSHSAADLRSAPFHPTSPQPFFYPHPHFVHPQMHSFAHAVPQMNYPQCLTGSWSNMMGPHMPPYHQQWNSAQSTLSRRQQDTVGDGQLRQRQNSLPDVAPGYPGPHMPFPPAAFPYVGSPFYPPGFPAAQSPLFMESPQSEDQLRQILKSPSSTSSQHSTERHEEAEQTAAQRITGEVQVKEAEQAEGEVEEAEEEAEEVAEEDTDVTAPEIPVEPWSCVHCTFINPPGSYICQICCKTSYPSPLKETRKQKKKKKSEGDSSVLPGTSQRNDAEELTNEESMQVDSEQQAALDSEKVI